MVDAQGWGEEVTTCGYGNLQGGASEDVWYTDNFGGTSSASPIVVGVLACVQGIRRAQGRSSLTPSDARALLTNTGSAQQASITAPLSQRIGTRPDLRELVQKMQP
jgi:subtilisin family serine protease